MDEKKKGKKKETSDGNEGHKKPWQEVYATPEEIKAMLANRVSLRYNEVRGRTEIHYYSRGPEIRVDDQGLLTIFGGDGGVTDGYQNLTDRDVNTLWTELSSEKPVVKEHLRSVIESDYVHRYHPFRFYLEHLPPWTDDGGNAILDLSLTVKVKGHDDEQILFYLYLQKWLVGMVASWMEDAVVNNVMLVLIGDQGAYKTTWFANLLPPQLRQYFYTKTNSGLVSKDDLLTLAKYGLVCWEELYFRKPSGKEPGEFMPVSLALQIVGAGITQKLNTVTLGRAFRELGFQDRVQRHTRGYVVVRRSVDEMRSIRQLPPQQTGTDTDGTEIF